MLSEGEDIENVAAIDETQRNEKERNSCYNCINLAE